MKTSEAFKIARKHLWNGKNETRQIQTKYCCCTVDMYVGRVDPDAAFRCRVILQRLLGGFGTLEGWLVSEGVMLRKHYFGKPPPEVRRKIQATRKAWLTHLIKHYQALGD